MRRMRALCFCLATGAIGLAAPAAIFAADAMKIIYVVTDDQKLYAWEGNELKFEYDVVTGRPGKETHAGVFSVFRKHEEYRSKTYDVDMPYTM